MKKNDLMNLEEFKEMHYGKRGTSKRDKLEEGYENFRLGALIQEARHEKGYSQEELAQRTGTSRSVISKIENNIEEISLSSLRRIVTALGGKLNLSIEL